MVIGANEDSMRNHRRVLDDRLVEIELALFAQLQEDDPEKGFGDRADLKQLFGFQLALPIFEVAIAVRRDALYTIAIREHERHPRAVHVAH